MSMSLYLILGLVFWVAVEVFDWSDKSSAKNRRARKARARSIVRMAQMEAELGEVPTPSGMESNDFMSRGSSSDHVSPTPRNLAIWGESRNG